MKWQKKNIGPKKSNATLISVLLFTKKAFIINYLSFSASTASFNFCALSSVERDATKKNYENVTQIDADGLQHEVVL